MIELCIPLYGPPAFDLDSKMLNPVQLQEQGLFLHYHLFRISYIVAKLQSAGWKLVPDPEMFVLVYHSDHLSLESVVKELRDLQIPSDLVEIFEVDDSLCEE